MTTQVGTFGQNSRKDIFRFKSKYPSLLYLYETLASEYKEQMFTGKGRTLIFLECFQKNREHFVSTIKVLSGSIKGLKNYSVSPPIFILKVLGDKYFELNVYVVDTKLAQENPNLPKAHEVMFTSLKDLQRLGLISDCTRSKPTSVNGRDMIQLRIHSEYGAIPYRNVH